MLNKKDGGRETPHEPETEEDFELGLERDVPRGLHGDDTSHNGSPRAFTIATVSTSPTRSSAAR